MIDNIKIIEQFILPETEDDFYFVQILKRKKEHPELGRNSYCVKTYYIKNFEDLERNYGEMKCLANFHNARVYINLNKRSFERMAFHNLRKLSDIILNKDYKSARKAYNSVCGTYSADTDKKWIIDIDTLNSDISGIKFFLNEITPKGDKYLAAIPTKNGMHLITKPFNVEEFKWLFPPIEIHKNNPTVLFIP